MLTNPNLLLGRLVNDSTVGTLFRLGISTPLIEALNNEDVIQMINKNVFISTMYSPASMAQINTSLPAGSRIIELDANTIEELFPNTQERVAIILHEIGHAITDLDLKQKLDPMGKEFAADDFAIARGYLEPTLSGLITGFNINPTKFDTHSNRTRMVRLNQIKNGQTR